MKRPRTKTLEILEVFRADRIGASPTPFSAISLLQTAHARNTPPPGDQMEQGAAGASGAGLGWRGLGLAGGSGGWLVAGGSGGWLVAWRRLVAG